MLNIFRMENYRLRKSRYPKIILVLVLFITIGMLFFSDVLIPRVTEQMQEEAQQQALEQESGNQSGESAEQTAAKAETESEASGPFQLDVNLEMGTTNDEEERVQANSRLEAFSNFLKPESAPILLMIGIFAALFVSENYKTGFAKNYVGNFTERGHIIVAQYISAILFMLGALFFTFIAFNLFKVFFTAETIAFGNVLEFLPALGSQLLGYAAFIAMIFLVYYLTRSQAQTLIFAVLYSMDVIAQGLRIIELALDNYLKLDVELASKLLGVRLNNMSFMGNRSEMITLVLYAFFIICVSLGLSSVKFQRSDIH